MTAWIIVSRTKTEFSVPFCCETHNQVKTRATNHTYEKVNPLARSLIAFARHQQTRRDLRCDALCARL